MNRSHIWKIGLLVMLIVMMVLFGNRQVTVAGEEGDVYLPAILNNASFINWAFEETFDGDPSSPSQALLPDSMDYSVTHKTHPAHHFEDFNTYLADHNHQCAGPNPDIQPLPQHLITTTNESNGKNIDESFYVCKNHMMSSMGEVSAYSVSAFWPRQEFEFSKGGYLEFDVNINDNHSRSWFEVLLMPRSELKVSAAHDTLPIDEAYPKDRIVLEFDHSTRYIQVGAGAIDPLGILVEERESESWRGRFPADPANDDRRIRRKMRVFFGDDYIDWSIEKADGEFDSYRVDVPGGLPFTRGLVVFKTHAYTPTKDGNMNSYTFHWDNIRFSGPVVGRYESVEAANVVYLQANGDRRIGDRGTNTIVLDEVGANPILFGQVHSPQSGQVLLRINGRSPIIIHPYDYNPGTCSSTGWKSFQLPVDPAWLKEGTNTFTWEVGVAQSCAEDWLWDGFSIKGLELQFDVTN